MNIEPIAYIYTGFATKFGIPRQSGLVPDAPARIVFEPTYCDSRALIGIDGFDYAWLIWGFSEGPTPQGDDWSPMVHPPRLGGNTKMGVWATRSPNRPNGLGLSSVKIGPVEDIDGQLTLTVYGADLLDGTPIYDIKPYVTYADAHPDARSGFAVGPGNQILEVQCADQLAAAMGEHRDVIMALLEQDPRPGYQDDPDRVYGMDYQNINVKFTVEGPTLIVRSVGPSPEEFQLKRD